MRWNVRASVRVPAAVWTIAVPLDMWRRTVVRAWRNGRKDNLNVLAGGIAFYVFLALLPFAAAIATIYGLIARDGKVVTDIGTVLSLLPDDAAELVAMRVGSVIADRSVGLLGPAVALLIAGYGAARGARSIVSGLNVMYGRGPRVRFVERWGIAVAIALAGAALTLLALLGIALHSAIERLLPSAAEIAYTIVRVLFWVGMSVGVAVSLALLYRYGPAGRNAPWRWLLPGAVTATAAWLAASLVFGAYVSAFDRFDRTYGPLSAVVVLQLWLYLSAFAMLFGAKLNAEAERHAALLSRVKKRTLAPPLPFFGGEAALITRPFDPRTKEEA